MSSNYGSLRAPFLFAFLLLSGSAYGQQNKVNHELLQNSSVINSTIDSTPIGQSVPANGNFNSVNVANMVSQGFIQMSTGYSAMQFLPGTSAPLRRGITWGTDPAGDFTFWLSSGQQNAQFVWRDSNGGGQIANLTPSGVFTTGSDIVSTGGTLRAGTQGGVTAGSQGFYTTYTSSLGQINSSGGINVNGGDVIASGSNSIRSGPNGIVTAGNQGFLTGGPYKGTTGSFSGSVSASGFLGNASTATALANGGASCPYAGGTSGYFRPLVGVNAQGGGTCGPLHEWVQSNGNGTCSASGGSYSTCQVTLYWPLSFGDTAYSPVCSGGGPGGAGNQPGAGTTQIASFTASSITVNIANQASNSGVTFSALYCSADHQ